MYYVFKIIMEAKGKTITSQEVLERLKEYDIQVDIKTIHSCVHRINEFFYEWIGDNLILIVRKGGLRIQKE